MVAAVAIIIASNMSVAEKFPTETMTGTPASCWFVDIAQCLHFM